MPVHDWKPAGANLFRNFHLSWAVRICDVLNRRLPKSYAAILERDVFVRHPGGLKIEPPELPEQPDPKTRFVFREPEKRLPNHIAIKYNLRRTVCVIEIVSPVHKSSRHALRQLVNKTMGYLQAGVHVLVVDLFRPSVRDPGGIHKAMWDEVENVPFALPDDKPFTLAAYVAEVPLIGYVEPVGLGDVLPDMPAYLTTDGYIDVPLEETYAWAWASCPEAMQRIVETGIVPRMRPNPD